MKKIPKWKVSEVTASFFRLSCEIIWESTTHSKVSLIQNCENKHKSKGQISYGDLSWEQRYDFFYLCFRSQCQLLVTLWPHTITIFICNEHHYNRHTCTSMAHPWSIYYFWTYSSTQKIRPLSTLPTTDHVIETISFVAFLATTSSSLCFWCHFTEC